MRAIISSMNPGADQVDQPLINYCLNNLNKLRNPPETRIQPGFRRFS